jgi:hypothetical protein
MSDEETVGKEVTLAEIIEANQRGYNDYFAWKHKQTAELGAVNDILTSARIAFEGLVSRPEGQDPPDCEALVDGELVGIEVTELVHRRAMERSLKAQKEDKQEQERQDRELDKLEFYFVWDRAELLRALQALIDRKDGAEPKGGPYSRYILVIHSDEAYLDAANVKEWLTGAPFRASRLTDALLGLSYHPSHQCCPVFQLSLLRCSDDSGVVA